MSDNRTRIPHRKFQLKPLPREDFTPAADKPEGVCIANRGYWTGSSYIAAEIEFMNAVVAWQRKYKTKFLAHIAYLRIAQSLGYVRPTQPATTQPRSADAPPDS